jgi:hypothetical protein
MGGIMRKQNFSTRMDRATIRLYKKYLKNSEDTATSKLREDTYINGFRDACLWFIQDLQKDLKEGKQNVK